MKKFIYLVLALIFVTSPVMAADKAQVSLGSIKFKNVTSNGANSIVAANIGSSVQIALGGTQGTSAGTLTVYLSSATVAALAKGQKINVTSTGNESDASAANILFLGSSVKVNGFSSTSLSIASNSDTVATGTLTVVGYNPSTKELKFSLSATAKPYTQITSKFGQSADSKDVNKPLKITAKVIVTLP